MSNKINYTELVELHERKWGENQYPNRPTLQQLLRCPIIALWRSEGRFMFSAHETPDDLNDTILAVLTDMSRPSWKLYKIFYRQQPIEFRVKVTSPEKKPSNKKKPYQYPDQPKIVDTNPQRELREVKPYKAPYTPKIARTNPLMNTRDSAPPKYYPKPVERPNGKKR